MGGCVSKPKEFFAKATQSVPTEAPATSSDKPDPQELLAVDAQESKNEEPLLDVSEPKEEGAEKPAEPEAANAEAVPKEVAEEVSPKAEEDKATEAVAEAKVVEETPKEEVKVEESNRTEDSAPASSEDKTN